MSAVNAEVFLVHCPYLAGIGQAVKKLYSDPAIPGDRLALVAAIQQVLNRPGILDAQFARRGTWVALWAGSALRSPPSMPYLQSSRGFAATETFCRSTYAFCQSAFNLAVALQPRKPDRVLV